MPGFWLIILVYIASCRSDDNTPATDGISGEWRLIEVLADPGDGSGLFIPVESQKQITILDNDTFSSNGELCDLSILAGSPTEGIILEDDQGYYLDCESTLAGTVRLNIENGNLIVSFFCIEPCLHKYLRTN